MFIINKQEEVNFLRQLREKECFSVINRGKLWYDSLTPNQYQQLKKWYKEWLNVTETFDIPERLSWIDEKVDMEEIIW